MSFVLTLDPLPERRKTPIDIQKVVASVASLPHCLIASLPHCLIASLPQKKTQRIEFNIQY